MEDMSIAVLGAGAIGSLLGGRLSAAGLRVTLVDRGERARYLKTHGVTIRRPGGDLLHSGPVHVSDAAEAQHPHDVVILAVKSHEIRAALPALAGLLDEETAVVTVQNGLPWWYFERHGGPLEGRRLETLDPDGVIAAAIDSRRVLGCIAYPAADIEPSGVTRHVEGERFPLGEPDGSNTARALRISELLVRAGFKAPVLANIREELWLKLWGNLSINPVSALTRATMSDICGTLETRSVITRMMQEAQQIASALGIRFRVTLERRLEGAAKVGSHRTSMLQDLEAGRPLELEAVVGVVLELGRLMEVEAPTIETVYALTSLLNSSTCNTAGAGYAPPGPGVSRSGAAAG
jgi:2-dehydropantoate 2-reductase